MKRNIDVLLDDDGDLLLDENKDPIVGDVSIQNQKLLLNTRKGDWKLYPLVGVGAKDFVDDETAAGLLREIRQQFTKDGMKVKTIDITNNAINIDASYL